MAQTKAVADARIALDKATENAPTTAALASVRQDLDGTAQNRTGTRWRNHRLRELIAREESAVQLATSRAKDYASQRDLLRLPSATMPSNSWTHCAAKRTPLPTMTVPHWTPRVQRSPNAAND